MNKRKALLMMLLSPLAMLADQIKPKEQPASDNQKDITSSPFLIETGHENEAIVVRLDLRSGSYDKATVLSVSMPANSIALRITVGGETVEITARECLAILKG